MATRTISGGPIPGVVATFAPVSTWTDSAVGDLVKQSTAANYNVAECADSNVPLGIVRQVSPDGRTLSVEVFTKGAIARLPYTGTPSLGQQIQASAATTVKGVASGGAGLIVAKDIESGTVDALFA
jgi:acyl-CoA reductase-like NAD-dependent aldehyde dehydrogenase